MAWLNKPTPENVCQLRQSHTGKHWDQPWPIMARGVKGIHRDVPLNHIMGDHGIAKKLRRPKNNT